MPRYVIVSDLHGDSSTAGFPRFSDVEEALWQSVEYATEKKADGFIFAGDLITNDPPLELMLRNILLCQRVRRRLSRDGIPSFWIPGNHDVFESSQSITAVDPIEGEGAVVIKSPAIIDNILFLPFTCFLKNYDPEAECRRLAEFNPNVKMVVGHLNVEGISFGSETTDFPRGRDVFLPVATIKELFPKALILNGHYHKRQLFNGVQIIGSLVPLTRGEVTNQPGFLDVTV